MNMQCKKLFISGLCVVLSGCALAPEYQQPEIPVAGSFANRYLTEMPAAAGDQQVNDVANLGWHDVFVDPVLQQLIKTALQNNRDLRETALNVEAYQAQYRIQRSAQFPNVAATGYGQKQTSFSGVKNVTSEIYALDVGITSYELDLYGRIRDLKDQALEQYLAMEETQKSATISLIAEIARSYLTWLTDRELLEISEDTKKVENESYALVEQRVKGGVANELDLAQARTSLETVKANLAMYRRQVAQDFNNLNLLAGAMLPDTLVSENRLLTNVEPLAVLPPNLSSDVLLQRPDIMAAEHELKGANANIGAARAAFFPTVTLTATAGVINPKLSNLFDGNSGSSLFSPAISVPIFTAGKLQAELDVAKIQKNIFVARYQKAIQTAFQEVSDSLIGIETYDQQVFAQKANLEANEQYFSYARSRYQEGVDSFLTLLDSQRSLYKSRQEYLVLKLAQLENQVNLYKVLGGGWKEFTK